MKHLPIRTILLGLALGLSIIFNFGDAARAAKTEIASEVNEATASLDKDLDRDPNRSTTAPSAASPVEPGGVSPEILQSLDIANPPPPSAEILAARVPEYTFNYRHELSLATGEAFNSTSTNGTNTPYLLGTQMMFDWRERGVYSAAANWLSDGTGDLEVARVFPFEFSRIRPFLKAGVSLLVNPQDQLAIFVKFNNFRLLGALGTECFFSQQAGLRVEFAMIANSTAFSTLTSVGIIWAW